MNKKLLIVVGILAVAAVLLAAFYFYSQKKNTAKGTPVEKTDLQISQLPSGFSADFPVEAGSTIIQNYEATQDGKKQSTRMFTTNKSLEDAVKVYIDYFTDKGWAQIPYAETEEGVLNVIFAKDNDALTINATADITTKEKTVTVTLTESAKQ